MWQKLILIFLLWSSVSAQSFFYSYVDPCQQTVVRSNYTITGDQKGFQVTYYAWNQSSLSSASNKAMETAVVNVIKAIDRRGW